jgi:hypothetical protein
MPDVWLYAGQVSTKDVILGDPTAMIPHEIVLAASANIAAGGVTATTAQLTAPATKTTGDFDAGLIADDTNPLTVNITTDNYTELEWALQGISGAELTTYEFRVVVAGQTLTYTVTPVLTLDASGGTTFTSTLTGAGAGVGVIVKEPRKTLIGTGAGVGGSHSVRRWFISELAKKGIAVSTFGYGWPTGPIAITEIADIFQTSKINLNLSNSINFDLRYLTHNIKNPIVALTSKKDTAQIKARNFEIPFYGGFQLTDYVPKLEIYFNIGTEISCYTNVDEAAQLIKYYLDNESEREAIKIAGIARAHREHSYTHRHKAYLEKIL